MLRFMNVTHVDVYVGTRHASRIRCNAVEFYVPTSRRPGRAIMYDLVRDNGTVSPSPTVLGRVNDIEGARILDMQAECVTSEWPVIIESYDVELRLGAAIGQAVVLDPMLDGVDATRRRMLTLMSHISTWERRLEDIRDEDLRDAIQMTLRSLRARLSNLERKVAADTE